MDFLQNFLNPVVLFFLLGVLAPLVRSTLELPTSLSRFLSLYLLMNIGLRGGVEFHRGGISFEALTSFGLALLISCAVPIYSFYILKPRLRLEDTTAISASYGSISLVTFLAASAFLDRHGVEYGGYMVASMAIMEAPAIVIALLLYHVYKQPDHSRFRLKPILRESLFNQSVYLLLGALLIGALAGEEGWRGLKPFSEDIFKGFLALFLLDMGLLVGTHLRGWKHSLFLFFFSIFIPIANAALAIGLAWTFGLSKGDTFMLTALAASASYIAVPAAMRMILPTANPSFYVTMPLAFTFPFNIIIGLPLYWRVISALS